MLSEVEQIPVKHTVEKPTDLRQNNSAGHLYAIMRRLGERITDIERRQGENSRDIARIEQKLRRTASPPILENPEKPKDAFIGLFGMEE